MAEYIAKWKNNNNNYIGFELDKHYCDIANERIQKALAEKEVGE